MAAIPQQNQLQHPQSIPFRFYAAIDGQTSAPISLFNPASFPEQPHPSFVNAMGLAPGQAVGRGSSGWEPRRTRVKEHEFLDNSQGSSVDFLQMGSVSTGLGLSLDNGRVVGSSFEDSPLPLPFPTFHNMIDEEMGRELQRQDAEMDHFVKIQGDRLRQAILEKVQAKQIQALKSVEGKIFREIQEKEVEVEDINKKNTELEEQMKQLSVEVGTWQQRAKYNESMIAALKYNLQQVYAHQGRRDSKEGCGDSEVNDTAASFCKGGGGSSGRAATNFQLACKENKDIEELLACKVCRVNEICMLLLPCRHLCVCRDCESKLSFCPLCQSSKFIGMEIYM